MGNFLQTESVAVVGTGGIHPRDGRESRDAPGETAEDEGESQGVATEEREGEGRVSQLP